MSVHERRAAPRSTTVSQGASAPITFREVTRMPIGRDWLLKLIDISLDPVILVVTLFICALLVHGAIWSRHLLLAILVFFIAFPGYLHLTKTIPSVARHIIVNWLVISGLLFIFGCITGALFYFDPKLLQMWWIVAPVGQFTAQLLLRASMPSIVRLQGAPKRAVVAGINEQGIELARRLGKGLYTRLVMVGFFDDRADYRKGQNRHPLLGKLQELPRFANQKDIDIIYISLPMHSQPRILALLDALRDTTASIYFVPDLFVTDLIQGRVDSVQGLPVVAVCETPFTGIDGVLKRASDIIFSAAILTLLAPLLLIIALGVKLSSPGPVIFKQRRYGLDGKDIVVYKFRTMKVSEDGAVIQQACKGDPRVTRFGAFYAKLRSMNSPNS